MDDVHLHNHVVVHEVGKGTLVGHDAAHLGGGHEDIFGTLCGKETLYSLLSAQVELPVCTQHKVVVSAPLEFSHNGRTHHAAVSGYVYL